VGTVADGAALDTGSVGQKTFTVNAKDKAGNDASKTVTYTVADRAAPSINLTTPVDGSVYKLGQRVLAEYSCADEAGGSGLASCDGTVPVGAAIDTSEVGPKSFEVRAADNAGNGAVKTVGYSVVYDFDGFLWPLDNPPRVNRSKAGRALPVRFSLGSYRGPVPVVDGYPKVAQVECGAGAEPVDGDRARGSWKKNGWKQSKRGRAPYMFVWKTEKRWSGSCRQLILKLDDGTLHRVEVQFARRGRKHD
jgi:hypothetical protein